MDSKVLNIGDRREEFLLVIDPQSGLPAWVTTKDEFWINMVGSMLYDYLLSHDNKLTNRSLTQKKEFAAEMLWPDFKSAFMSGECARFKDTVIALYELLINPKMQAPTDRVYISFFSEVSDHFISAMIEDHTIKLGVKLNDTIIK